MEDQFVVLVNVNDLKTSVAYGPFDIHGAAKAVETLKAMKFTDEDIVVLRLTSDVH